MKRLLSKFVRPFVKKNLDISVELTKAPKSGKIRVTAKATLAGIHLYSNKFDFDLK